MEEQEWAVRTLQLAPVKLHFQDSSQLASQRDCTAFAAWMDSSMSNSGVKIVNWLGRQRLDSGREEEKSSKFQRLFDRLFGRQLMARVALDVPMAISSGIQSLFAAVRTLRSVSNSPGCLTTD